jgi:hypothetical protein
MNLLGNRPNFIGLSKSLSKPKNIAMGQYRRLHFLGSALLSAMAGLHFGDIDGFGF